MEKTEQVNVYQLLSKPFPKSALSKDTSRGFELTSIKAQYVVERLNEALGIFGWSLTGEYLEKKDGILYQGKLTINVDGKEKEIEGTGWSSHKKNMGDTFKSANTDCLSKAASKIGVGNEVFKGEAGKAPQVKETPAPKKQPIKEVKQPTNDKEVKMALFTQIVDIVTDLKEKDQSKFKDCCLITGPSANLLNSDIPTLKKILIKVLEVVETKYDDAEKKTFLKDGQQKSSFNLNQSRCVVP